jgi:hypothetical protein
VRALKSNAPAQVTARLKRLPRKSEKQVPRGLKPARDDKNKELRGAPFGRLRAGSGQALKVCSFKTPAEADFFSSL